MKKKNFRTILSAIKIFQGREKMSHFFKSFFLFFVIISNLTAAPWDPTAWNNSSTLTPVFSPLPSRAYYPTVSYDENKFNDNTYYYKMWYQGSSGIALAYSDNGTTWINQGYTNLPSSASHPVVIYDPDGFGGSIYFYKMWYWNGGTTISDGKYAESTDGVHWYNVQSITQDASAKLWTGSGYFSLFYGAGYVIYNPAPTSSADPYTWRYVMFFDAGGEQSVVHVLEEIGLAYSDDGLFWYRYGSVPIVIPNGNTSDWDGMYIYHPSVFKYHNAYHMYYSGANGLPIGSAGSTNGHGIGYASSLDGINWTTSTKNPIFYIFDGAAWRSNRTYTPWVIFNPFCPVCPTCSAKMFFSGVSSTNVYAIGFSTMPCPPPAVDAVSPNYGLFTGGNAVTLTGVSFTGAEVVLFGSEQALSFTYNSDSSITAIAPPGVIGTTVHVTVTSPSGISDTTSLDEYTYGTIPSISSVFPLKGSISGGTSVTLTGQYFTDATSVLFGSTPASTYHVNSDSSITVFSPPGSSGTVDIRVITRFGESLVTATDKFTYVGPPLITSISPDQGYFNGGTTVVINGNDLGDAYSILFGLNSALSFSVNSNRQITVISPAGSLGPIEIVISTPFGTSSLSPSDVFTYNLQPLPPSNFRGTLVTSKLLGKKEYVLSAAWKASPDNVAFYRIYDNGIIVKEISATANLTFMTAYTSKIEARNLKMTSVSADNIESVFENISLKYE